MSYQDPWDWANEPMRYPNVPQTNNTLQVPQNNPQQPQITQGPPGLGQMAQQIIVNRGINAGIDAGFKTMTPAKVAAPLAPVVETSNVVEPLPSIVGNASTAATLGEGAATAATLGEGAALIGPAAAAAEGTSLATMGAGLASTGMLAAVGGPLGLIGGLLLAKQMKWI